jgi:gamma-glutamyltranspeptidase / glutathione hydrolase
MTPTIVAKNQKLVLVTGSPGGRTIINTVLAVVLGVTEYGLTGRQAVDLARIHHQWMPDRVSVEESLVPAETIDRLRAMGHEVRPGVRQGDAHSIWIGPDGTVHGVNDTRTPDSKVSVPLQLTAPSGGR